jgi:hypothetical protein
VQLTQLGLAQLPAQFWQTFTNGKGEQQPDNNVPPKGRSA